MLILSRPIFPRPAAAPLDGDARGRGAARDFMAPGDLEGAQARVRRAVGAVERLGHGTSVAQVRGELIEARSGTACGSGSARRCRGLRVPEARRLSSGQPGGRRRRAMKGSNVACPPPASSEARFSRSQLGAASPRSTCSNVAMPSDSHRGSGGLARARSGRSRRSRCAWSLVREDAGKLLALVDVDLALRDRARAAGPRRAAGHAAVGVLALEQEDGDLLVAAHGEKGARSSIRFPCRFSISSRKRSRPRPARRRR